MFEIWLWNNYNEIADTSDCYRITIRFISKKKLRKKPEINTLFHESDG